MKPYHNLLNRTGLPALGLLALTAAVPANGADYPTTVLSFNPLAYYRLSETAAVPPANAAANFGSLGSVGTGYVVADVTNGNSGIVGTAFRFTNPGGAAGTFASRVEIPNRPELNPNGPFTVECWVKPSAAVPGGSALLAPISSINGNQSRSGWILYQTSANQWEFRVGGLASYAGTIDTANNTVQIGTFQHVVCTFDGLNIALYLNGVLAAGPTPANGGAGFNPNSGQATILGASGLANRGFDGWLDEVAIYSGVLSPSVIAAHHDAATTNNAGYQAQILLASPVGYWHLDEPFYTAPDPSTLPETANSGTLGTAARGTNYPGLTAGVAGPPYSGMGLNNLGASSGYGAGNVDLGNPAGLDLVGPITMMAWINPQFTIGLRDIVAHGFGASSEVFMRISAGNYEVGSWNGSTTFSVSGAMNSGGLGSDVGNWVFIAATYDGANWNLYRYDNLVTNAPFVSGSLSVPDAPWSIGSAGPNSNGRNLGGAIDEVAIFDTALTLPQIQQIFYSANVAPIIVTPLPTQVSPPIYVGSSLNLVVAAEGNKPLSYLWTKNGVSLGNTSTSLSIASLQTSDSGTYAVIATNPSGSTTSSVPVTVVLLPPQIVSQPVSATRFVGSSARFSVAATGSSPLTYQWKSNNVAISGATTTNLNIVGIQSSYAANYGCTVTGPGGVTNSANAALTVLPFPTAGYPDAALADNPIGYWRLGESSGTVAHDYWGGHDGTYHGVTLGVPGYAPPIADPDTAASFGAADVYVGNISGIDFGGTGHSFSLEAWVKGPSLQQANATLIGKGTGQNGTGGANAWQFVLDVTGGFYRFHVEPATGTASDATATAGPDGSWQHVVATYDAVGNAMQVYVNGIASGSSANPPAAGPMPTLLPVSIGAGQGGVTPIHDLYFNGSMDEVAIYNTALSPDQVVAHYGALYGTNTPPQIATQPVSVTNFVSLPASVSVGAFGSVIPTPLAYQWFKNGSPIANATDTAYSISALALSDAGNYFVHVTNSVGSTNSRTVGLGVLAAPASPPAIPGLVLHLPFDNNLLDATGRGNNGAARGAPTFVPDGMLGQGLHYFTDINTTNAGSTYFVTSANYVTLGVRPDLFFGANIDFSVSMWVRLPLNYTGGDLPFFTDTTNSTFGPGFVFAPSYGSTGQPAPTTPWNGSWAFSLYNNAASAGIGVYGQPIGSINDGNWHHLVHVFDREQGNVNYVDGILAGYAVQGGTSIIDAGNVDLPQPAPANIGQDAAGAYTSGGDNFSPGPGALESSADIDDLGVWHKALTPLEAASIYMAAISNHLSFTGTATLPGLSVIHSGQNVILTWSMGALQAADNVTGPYVDVLGATTPDVSPLTVPASAARKFYRIRGQ